MTTVIDTSIWSLVFRRRPKHLSPRERALRLAWRELVASGDGIIIGAVRQELLTGLADDAQFDRVRGQLQGYDDLALGSEDYELAAGYANRCLRVGIEGSPTDFLICAAADRRGLDILTTDDDFPRYARILPIRLRRV